MKDPSTMRRRQTGPVWNGPGRVLVILTLTLMVAATTLGQAQGPGQPRGEDLVAALRAGGFNIYFRHAETNWRQTDQVDAPGDWTACDPERMRQLSDEGRRNARQVGDAIRALGIPIGAILASPYCRTVETARLMNLGAVTPTTDIVNLRVASYFGGRDAVVATARAQLARQPDTGTNTILVAHGNVARESTPVYPSEAEGIVFRADGHGGFTVFARLTPDSWARLAEDHAQSVR